MTLPRDFKKTVVERVERDPAFAKALLDEAASLFLSGEPDAARLILRELVNATVGFEALAELTNKPSKSLHRMPAPKSPWCSRDTTTEQIGVLDANSADSRSTSTRS